MFELISANLLGLPLVAWGGIITLAILIFQILVGFRIIKIDFKYHKYIALVLLLFAVIHAIAAFVFISGK